MNARRRLVFWLAGLLICTGWDRAVWLAVTVAGKVRYESLEHAASVVGLRSAYTQVHTLTDLPHALAATLYAMAYFAGRLWPWLIIALVLLARGWTSSDTARVKRGVRESVLVILPVITAGAAAELLKLISRRYRPEHSDGFYAFKPFTHSPIDPEFWNTSGLGLASSHASVALAGAMALSIILPTQRFLLLAIATLCCLSRLLVGAHYLSDVYIGATLGVLATHAITSWDTHNNGGVPLNANRSQDQSSRG